jgi:2-keto-3-deoxy-L-rhamnonate aldolase RhmA
MNTAVSRKKEDIRTITHGNNNLFIPHYLSGGRSGTVVEALRYKPEGHGIDS